MADLHLASARWQNNPSQGVAAGLAPRTVRTLAAPIHAVEAGKDVALCGARAPITEGKAWTKASGACPRCADLAKSHLS